MVKVDRILVRILVQFSYLVFCGFLWVMKRKFEKCEDVGILVKKVFEMIFKAFFEKVIFCKDLYRKFSLTTYFFFFFLVVIKKKMKCNIVLDLEIAKRRSKVRWKAEKTYFHILTKNFKCNPFL